MTVFDENDGIFVLGGVFSPKNVDLLTNKFWQKFFKSFENFPCLELKFKKFSMPVFIFRNLVLAILNN